MQNTTCANGTPAGLGTQFAGDEKDLVLYFEGGGACWNAATCYGLKTATHLTDTYSKELLDEDLAPWRTTIFERSDAENPFKSAAYVYVPYCTGDLHAGTNVAEYNIGEAAPLSVKHLGAKNVEVYLDRIRRTFKKLERIWIVGVSAGGYGASFNLPVIAKAFPTQQLHVLADGSPSINPAADRWAEMKTSWKPILPACTTCGDDLSLYLRTVVDAHPASRYALLTYTSDPTITTLTGLQSPEEFAAGLANAYAKVFTAPNTRYFVVQGNVHVTLKDFDTLAGPGGVTLKSWVSAWSSGSADWKNLKP